MLSAAKYIQNQRLVSNELLIGNYVEERGLILDTMLDFPARTKRNHEKSVMAASSHAEI